MQDLITVNAAHFSEALDLDHPDAIHPVGASHLKEYLTIMYGEEVPEDEVARRLSDQALQSLAAFSLNHSLVEIAKTDPLGYVPQWIRSFSPVVDDTKALGKLVSTYVDGMEKTAQYQNPDITIDFVYSLGLFDALSFVIAAQLELPHPRFQYKNLMKQAEEVTPEGYELAKPTSAKGLEALINSGIVKAAYARKLTQLRAQGQRIVDSSNSCVERVRSLLKPEED